MRDIEEWRFIPGYEGYYQASTHGRIRSVDRVVNYRDNRVIKKPGKILSQNKQQRKQKGLFVHSVLFTVNCKSKKFLVHRLVALTFIGPCPEGYEVCHNDGNPSNNHISNLRYGTRRENSLDRYKHGTMSLGSQANGSKLTEENVRFIKKNINRYTQRYLSRLFNVNQSSISYIKSGRHWSHINV